MLVCSHRDALYIKAGLHCPIDDRICILDLNPLMFVVSESKVVLVAKYNALPQWMGTQTIVAPTPCSNLHLSFLSHFCPFVRYFRPRLSFSKVEGLKGKLHSLHPNIKGEESHRQLLVCVVQCESCTSSLICPLSAWPLTGNNQQPLLPCIHRSPYFIKVCCKSP